MIKFAFCLETQSEINIDNYDFNIHKTLLCKYNHPLLPKLGKQLIHHYSHYPNTLCSLTNPKTIWHENWQKLFKKTEVAFRKEIGKHIADIVTENNRVVEIQHSPISEKDIKSREKTYKDMIWIFDIRNEITGSEFVCKDKNFALVKASKKYLFSTEKETYYDCGNYLLKKIDILNKYLLCEIIPYDSFFSSLNETPLFPIDLLITNSNFSFAFEIEKLFIKKNPFGKIEKIYFETDSENDYTPFLSSKYIPNRYFLPF
jgi:hypothetical protein